MKRQELKKKTVEFFTYSGVTKQEYEEIGQSISEKNNHAVKVASLTAFLLFAIQFLLSLVVPAMKGLTRWCGAALVFLAAFRIWVYQKEAWKIQNEEHKRKCNRQFFYVLLTMLYVFTIAVGTVFRHELTATAFPVLLCVAPLLFVELPWKMSLYLTGVTGIFCAMSAFCKTPELVQLDCVNAFCCLILVTIVYANIVQVKVHDLKQRCSIVRTSEQDGLTKLLRKKSAEEEIRKYIVETGNPAVLLMIDVDNFKSVNDVYGHTFGDVVLRTLADCISEIFRETDIKGRFGGDEFVIFLTHMENREVVIKRVEMLMKLITEKISMPDGKSRVHISVGIAMYPEQACTYEELFSHADEALYQSKNGGKNCYTFYLDQPVRRA